MSGLLNTADQILFSSLEKQPEESADALAAKGFALVQQEKITEALAIYEKVLNIEPEHFDTLQTLGSILVGFKQFDIAIQLLSRAIEINPNHALPYYNLGIALKEVGRAEEALDSYKNAISIQPDYAEAYFNRDDSPWYPSVKLYRQEEKGNWDDVLLRVRDDLKVHFFLN